MTTPSPRPNRTLHHRRLIDCHGYLRDDGLWDLEAELIDTKTVGFPNRDRGFINPGEPIHGLKLRVTIDLDFKIHEVEVNMNDTPYRLCNTIESAYQQMVGQYIREGYGRKIKELFRGEKGCVHVTELWRAIGTLAHQTTFPTRFKKESQTATEGLIGSCHMHTHERVHHNVAPHHGKPLK